MSTTSSAYNASTSEPTTSISAMPVHPDVTGSARYSCACKPMLAALMRSGMSLLTRTTSAPSAARLRATASRRLSLSPRRYPCGRSAGSVWFSSTRTVPPASLTVSGSSSRPCSMRRASSRCRACRANQPSSAWLRFASSSVITTMGRTTSCSSKRPIAAGSASRTLVSRTKVRWLDVRLAAVTGPPRRRWPWSRPPVPTVRPRSVRAVATRGGRTGDPRPSGRMAATRSGMIVRVEEPAWVGQLPSASVREFPALDDDVLDLHEARVVDASASVAGILENAEIVNVAMERCDIAGVVAHNGRMDRVFISGSRLRGVTWAAGMVQDAMVVATTGGDLSLRFSTLRRVTFRDCVLPELDFTEVTFDQVRLEHCVLTGARFHGATVKSLRIEGCDLTGCTGAEALSGASVAPGDLLQLAPSLAAALGITLD